MAGPVMDSGQEMDHCQSPMAVHVQAFEHYSKAIELDPSLTVAYNNRAMTRLKLGDWLGAEADCDAVLTKEPTSIKALHRRATAR